MTIRTLSEFTKEAVTYINLGRGIGNTTALVNLIKSDPNAVLVVTNLNEVSRIIKEYDLYDSKQIISMHQFNNLKGRYGFYPVFDNFVLSQIFGETNQKLKKFKEFVEELNEL